MKMASVELKFNSARTNELHTKSQAVTREIRVSEKVGGVRVTMFCAGGCWVGCDRGQRMRIVFETWKRFYI